MKQAIILAIAAFFLTGCKNSTQSSPETFTNGTQWIYSDDTFDSTGHLVANTTDTVTITSSSISGSQKTLMLSDSSHFILISSGSSWVLSQIELLSVAWPFPGNIGDTIYMSGNIPTKLNGSVHNLKLVLTELQTGVNVTVPAGLFSCVTYELNTWDVTTGILWFKQLIYVSPTTGVTERDYYQTKSDGTAYLSIRKQLLKVQ